MRVNTEIQSLTSQIAALEQSLEVYKKSVLEQTDKLYREISMRRLVEEETFLLQTVTKEIAEAEDLHAALDVVLRKICESTDWIYGEAWFPSRDGKYLECHHAWCKQGENLEEFSEKSKKFTFKPGVGLPGRVWSYKRPEWRQDAFVDSNFPRYEICKEHNLRASMGMPIMAGNEVVGILNFFARTPREEDKRLISLVSSIAAQLGMVVKRKQAEETLRESEEKFRNITTSAFDAIIMMGDEGKISFWNEAAEKVFGYTREEAMGKILHHLIVPPEYYEEFSKGFEKFKETGQGAIIGKMLILPGLRKDGEVIYAEHAFSAIKIRNKWHSMCTLRDVTGRKLKESRQKAQFTLTHILAESATLGEAAPKLLQAICEGFGWEYGELWRVDPDSDRLRLKEVWHLPLQELVEFENASRTFTFTKGIGLPGSVWENGQPAWITDVVADSNFPRAPIASRLGIHGAMAFPVTRKNEVIGVMEFFTKFKRLPDKEVFDLMADIGRRIGAFINRKLAEGALEERSYLAALEADVGLALARGGTLRDILQQCAEAMVRNLGVAFARIWTLNKEENMLELQSSAGIYTHIDGEHSRVPVGMYKIGLIAKERKPHLTNNVIGDPRVHNQEWAKQMGMVAFAGYPLVIEDHLVGVIAMFSRKPLTEITHRALASVSDVIALGIERKRTEETRTMLSDIMEMAADFVGTFHTNGNMLYVNKAGREILGISGDEDIKKLKITDCYPLWMKTLISDEAIPHAVKNGVWMGETVIMHRSGREIPVSQVIIAHRKAIGYVEYLSTITRDITERKHFESQILYMANRDPLTNLINRRRFQEELENCIIQTKRFGTQGAILFLDIDNFKYINDLLGHQMGDNLLVNLAGTLKERLREIDVLARLGGDEFAIVLSGVDEHHAVMVANQLRELIKQKVSLREEKPLGITASIGVALFPKHGDQAEMLYSCADLAMYRAKEKGRDRVCVYSPEQATQIELRLTWEKRIRESLNQNRLVLHLQPILDLHKNTIIGNEALLRMIDEKGEIIYPNQFLDIAERFGLIRDIDHWVVRESISLIKILCQKGKPSYLEVNLSGKSLNDPELLQLIKEKLIETGVNSVNVVFEITETAAIENIVDAERFIMSLKHLGCRFALDDFGIGFSSFNYLKHLSVDYLKIDGSFIQNLPGNPTDKHLVKAMVEIAHGLGKKIIAESVTSAETLRLLREFRVDYAQGYFIGKPRPLDGL